MASADKAGAGRGIAQAECSAVAYCARLCRTLAPRAVRTHGGSADHPAAQDDALRFMEALEVLARILGVHHEVGGGALGEASPP